MWWRMLIRCAAASAQPSTVSPYSPNLGENITADAIESSINKFTIDLRSTFERFLQSDRQLPLWHPSSGLADEKARRHLIGLQIPFIKPFSEFPFLLLHKLGQSSHHPQLAERIESLFPLK